MYANPEIIVPTALLEANAEAARKSPTLMATAFQRDARFLRAEFIKYIAPPRGAHRHKKGEMTPKQQRWWWAVGVKTWKGRTNKLQKGWRTDVKTTQAGGVFRYWNVVPYKLYVQGFKQQKMHAGTWAREVDAVAYIKPIAETRIRESWLTVSNPTIATRR
jgi:hypothetical protein